MDAGAGQPEVQPPPLGDDGYGIGEMEGGTAVAADTAAAATTAPADDGSGAAGNRGAADSSTALARETCKVEVLGARGLVAEEGAGLLNPYVVVSIERDVYQTNPAKKTLSPRWTNESFTFPNVEPSTVLTVQVLVTDGVAVGQVTMQASSMTGDLVWLALQPIEGAGAGTTQGEVELRCTFGGHWSEKSAAAMVDYAKELGLYEKQFQVTAEKGLKHRARPSKKSEPMSTYEKGENFQVYGAVQLADKTVRLKTSKHPSRGQWITNQSSDANWFTPLGGDGQVTLAAVSQRRRGSVSQTVTDALELVAEESLPDREFTVSWNKKPKGEVRLKVGGMGINIFRGDRNLETYMYCKHVQTKYRNDRMFSWKPSNNKPNDVGIQIRMKTVCVLTCASGEREIICEAMQARSLQLKKIKEAASPKSISAGGFLSVPDEEEDESSEEESEESEESEEESEESEDSEEESADEQAAPPKSMSSDGKQPVPDGAESEVESEVESEEESEKEGSDDAEEEGGDGQHAAQAAEAANQEDEPEKPEEELEETFVGSAVAPMSEVVPEVVSDDEPASGTVRYDDHDDDSAAVGDSTDAAAALPLPPPTLIDETAKATIEEGDDQTLAEPPPVKECRGFFACCTTPTPHLEVPPPE